jgi:Carboxypeptidase regulatory-like domain
MNSALGAAICCLGLALTAASQEKIPACKDLSYASRNQTDYGPLRVAAVRGIAKDSQGVAIPKACVGVFTETDHKLVASTQTDDNGNFELKDIPAGDYRLVAKYGGFSPANAKLRVERSRGKKTLAVQMRPAGLDTSSFVEVK